MKSISEKFDDSQRNPFCVTRAQLVRELRTSPRIMVRITDHPPNGVREIRITLVDGNRVKDKKTCGTSVDINVKDEFYTS